MKRVIIIMLMIFTVLFLVSCINENVDDNKVLPIVENTQQELDVGVIAKEVVDSNEVVEVTPVVEKMTTSCRSTSECTKGLYCIEGTCGTIETLYEQECANKCVYKGATLHTSDDEVYELVRGKGSYSYAGALSWKLLPTPMICPGEDFAIPIEITKVNYGEVLESNVITLRKEETSTVIIHPTAKKVAFTLEVQDINVDCTPVVIT
jgi:hypothetical protein